MHSGIKTAMPHHLPGTKLWPNQRQQNSKRQEHDKIPADDSDSTYRANGNRVAENRSRRFKRKPAHRCWARAVFSAVGCHPAGRVMRRVSAPTAPQ